MLYMCFQVNKSYMETHFPEVAKLDNHSVSSHCLYFEKFAKSYLLLSLRKIISHASRSTNEINASATILPYRLLRLLLDKPEISEGIVSAILPDVSSCFRTQIESLGGVPSELLTLKSMQQYHHHHTSGKESKKISRKSLKIEILQSANLFFSSLVPELLWQWMESAIAESMVPNEHKNSLPLPPTSQRGSDSEEEMESFASSQAVTDVISGFPTHNEESQSHVTGARDSVAGQQLMSCASSCQLVLFLLQTLSLVS